jgi:hypothetical protein
MKAQFITDTKAKLAGAHRVRLSDIVIIALTEGTITVTYAMPLMAENMENLAPQFAGQLGSAYLKHEIHPAFSQLQINQATFAPSWNRNFRFYGIASMCRRMAKGMTCPPSLRERITTKW